MSAQPVIGQAHEGTGRIAVTAEAFARSSLNGEQNAYWFDAEAEAWGMDPWSLIEGVDPMVDPNASHCDVWFTSGKCMTVPKSTLIFVRAVDAAAVASAA